MYLTLRYESSPLTGKSANQVSRRCASDMHLAFIMQFDAGDRHFISTAQNTAAGDKMLASAGAQIINTQVDSAHLSQLHLQLFFNERFMAH